MTGEQKKLFIHRELSGLRIDQEVDVYEMNNDGEHQAYYFHKGDYTTEFYIVGTFLVLLSATIYVFI